MKFIVADASIQLWHKRLGHPLMKVLRMLPFMSKSSLKMDVTFIFRHIIPELVFLVVGVGF